MKHIIVWSVIFSIYYSVGLIALVALRLFWEDAPMFATALLDVLSGRDIPDPGQFPSPQWIKPPLCFYVAAAWALAIMFVRYVLPRPDSREMKAEIRAQEALIDSHIHGLEEMGFSHLDAQRIVQLKQNAWWHDGLTPAEQRELNEITKRQFNQFRRAAE